MPERCFTPKSAAREIGRLRPFAERVSRLYAAMAHARRSLPVPEAPVEPGYFLLLARLSRTVDELRGFGVEVGDLARGRLDFPARRSGRRVFLSWEPGERAIAQWREGPAAAPRAVEEDGRWEDF